DPDPPLYRGACRGEHRHHCVHLRRLRGRNLRENRVTAGPSRWSRDAGCDRVDGGPALRALSYKALRFCKRQILRMDIAIIGASGYTGGELMRLLLNHSSADVVTATSRKLDGVSVASVHPHLRGLTDLVFRDIDVGDIDA